MAGHPYKGHREDKAGAKKAKAMVKSAGYQSGGQVLNFPGSQAMADARRLHFSRQHGTPYNPSAERPSNVVSGPGATDRGASQGRWLSRQEARDLQVEKRGGRVKGKK